MDVNLIKWYLKNKNENYYNFIINDKKLFLTYLRILIENDIDIPEEFIEINKKNIIKIIIVNNKVELFRKLFKKLDDKTMEELKVIDEYFNTSYLNCLIE